MYRFGAALTALALFLTACVGRAERVLTPVVGEPILVGDHPSAIAFTEDAVWVANKWGKAVSRIDPDTRQVVATIRLEPGAYQVPVPIDPNTGQVPAKIPKSANVVTLAAGEGGVWVLSSDGGGVGTITDKSGTTSWGLGSVSRIDPKTNQELARIPIGSNPALIAVGEGAVWVVNSDDGSVSRIDPKTNQVVGTISIAAISENVNKAALSMAVGEGSIWITSARANTGLVEVIVTRVSPKTNEVVATIPVARAMVGHVAVGEGAVWVACSSINSRSIMANSTRFDPNINPADWLVGSVVRIDPSTNNIVSTIPVPGYGIAIADGSVWITHNFAATLTQIDAKTNKVVGETIVVGAPAPSAFDLMKDESSGPSAIAVRKGTAWLAFEGNDVIKPVMLAK